MKKQSTLGPQNTQSRNLLNSFRPASAVPRLDLAQVDNVARRSSSVQSSRPVGLISTRISMNTPVPLVQVLNSARSSKPTAAPRSPFQFTSVARVLLQDDNEPSCITVDGTDTIEFDTCSNKLQNKSKEPPIAVRYQFSDVSHAQDTAQLYDEQISSIITSVTRESASAAILLYDSIGSGTAFQKHGLVPLLARQMFAYGSEQQEDAPSQTKIQVAYYRILNNRIYDMLNSGAKVDVYSGDTSSRNKRTQSVDPFVANIYWREVTNLEEFNGIMKMAMDAKQVRNVKELKNSLATSHNVLQIRCNEGAGSGSLVLIDLTSGPDLSVLKQVLEARRKKKSDDTIPYRQSKLTTVLKPFVSRGDQCILLTNIRAHGDYIDQAKASLEFAYMHKEVTRTVKLNEVHRVGLTTPVPPAEPRLPSYADEGDFGNLVEDQDFPLPSRRGTTNLLVANVTEHSNRTRADPGDDLFDRRMQQWCAEVFEAAFEDETEDQGGPSTNPSSQDQIQEHEVGEDQMDPKEEEEHTIREQKKHGQELCNTFHQLQEQHLFLAKSRATVQVDVVDSKRQVRIYVFSFDLGSYAIYSYFDFSYFMTHVEYLVDSVKEMPCLTVIFQVRIDVNRDALFLGRMLVRNQMFRLTGRSGLDNFLEQAQSVLSVRMEGMGPERLQATILKIRQQMLASHQHHGIFEIRGRSSPIEHHPKVFHAIRLP